MSNLGDFFDPSLRLQRVNDQLRAGSVVRLYVTTTKPPKVKRLVIIGENHDHTVMGGLFINTDINWTVLREYEVQEHQYFLHCEDYDREVIDRDCYVDCSRIQEIKRESLNEKLVENPRDLLGSLTESDCLAVLAIIKASPLFSTKQRKRFGLLDPIH